MQINVPGYTRQAPVARSIQQSGPQPARIPSFTWQVSKPPQQTSYRQGASWKHLSLKKHWPKFRHSEARSCCTSLKLEMASMAPSELYRKYWGRNWGPKLKALILHLVLFLHGKMLFILKIPCSLPSDQNSSPMHLLDPYWNKMGIWRQLDSLNKHKFLSRKELSCRFLALSSVSLSITEFASFSKHVTKCLKIYFNDVFKNNNTLHYKRKR